MDTVYAWGYGDVLKQALEGISMLVTQAEYVTWLKIALTLSMAVLLIAWIRGRVSGEGGIAVEAGLRNPWYPVTYFLATYLIFLFFVGGPVTRVTIVDKSTGDVYDVTAVPIGVAYPLAIFSTFEYRLGEIIETTFGVPNEISYTNSGLFSGLIALKNAVDHRIIDERIMGNLSNFSVDCVIPGILGGYISRDELLNGDFVAELTNVNPALTTTYRDTSGNVLVVDCQTALGNLIGDLNTYTTFAIDFLGKVTGLGAQFGSALSVSLSYLLNYTGTAQDFLFYNIFMNQFLIAQASWLQANGVSASQVAVGTALAERQLASQGVVTSFLAKSYIPVIKGIMTVIAVSSIPIVVILLMLGGTLFSRRVIFTGMMTVLLWLSLWHVIDVILNMIVLVKTGALFEDITSLWGSGGMGWSSLALYKQGLISSEAMRYVNMVGQYYWSVPFFALLVAGGFSMYTMNSLAGSGAGVVSSAASGAAAQVATGSFKAGEVGVNNIRMNTFTESVLTRNVFSAEVVNWRNWTEGNMSTNRVQGDLGRAGLEGFYGEATKTSGGELMVHSALGKGGFAMQNVLIQNGSIKPAGANATISAPSGEVMEKNLMKIDPNLANDVDNILKESGLSWDKVGLIEVRIGKNGYLLSFRDKEGASYSFVIGKGGHFGGKLDYAGMELGINEYGIISVKGFPVGAVKGELMKELGERRHVLETMIQEFNEKTEGWSDVTKAMYSEILKAYYQGKISAEEVKNAWETLKAIEDEYGVRAKGEAGTFRHGTVGSVSDSKTPPKPSSIFNRLPARVRKALPFLAEFGTHLRRRGEVQAGAQFRGREGSITKTGGRVATESTSGSGADETKGYGRDYSKVISENLRYLEGELKKLDNVYSQLQSEELSLTRNILPAIIDKYAEDRGISYSQAVRELSQNNWEKLYDLLDKFANDLGFRQDILERAKEIGKRVESETGQVSVDTSELKNQDIRGGVENKLEEQTKEVKEKAQELKKRVGKDTINTILKGESISTQIREAVSDRKKVAAAAGVILAITSLFGSAPNPFKTGGGSPGTGPKGLPGGHAKPLPGGSPEGLPEKSIPQKGLPRGINNPEQLREYAKKYFGIELTNDEAQRMIELRNRLYKTTSSSERNKILEEMQSIANKAASRNPEAFAKLQKGIPDIAPNVEKALMKQLPKITETAGEQGVKSLLKKIPLLSIAAGAFFAYQRAEEGDWKGAVLELASGIVGTVPLIGTGASFAIDGYLLARDLGIIDKSVSREEFEKVWNQALHQALNFGSLNELKKNVWDNMSVRDRVLSEMRTNPNFYLNYQGKQIRLDEEGNIYDYGALAERGWSVNPDGQIYDTVTGRIINNVDKSGFIIGRIT